MSSHSETTHSPSQIGLLQFLLLLNFEPNELIELFPSADGSFIRLSALYKKQALTLLSDESLWIRFSVHMRKKISYIEAYRGKNVHELLQLWSQSSWNMRKDELSAVVFLFLQQREKCPRRLYAILYADCEVMAVSLFRQSIPA